MWHFLILFTIISPTNSEITAEPNFTDAIANVTVPIGREAMLTCVVEDLGIFKVAWLRVDTQTILTIQSHVITKNHRVSITYSEHKTWQLKIKEIRETDKGWYMCQINTDPMKSQVGYLDVVVPPDIQDHQTSTDMIVTEGSNVTLKCVATGSPTPIILWKRESNERIGFNGSESVYSVEGSILTIPRVNRLHMGAYLCIASNGVPPTVSKRIMLIVHFTPMIWIQNQLVGVNEGDRITLECQSEAFPKSINYWTSHNGEIVPQGGKFDSIILDNTYKVIMKLIIKSVSANDFGSYKCLAKNSLGETDGTIKLYKLPADVNGIESVDKRNRGKARKGGNNYDSNDIVDDDSENISKRKDHMMGEIIDDSLEISSSSNHKTINLINFCIIISIILISSSFEVNLL